MMSEAVNYCSVMKQIFVENTLAAVLRVIDERIESVEYEATELQEYVIIKFSGGGTKRVCITGDSLSAVAKDVLKIF